MIRQLLKYGKRYTGIEHSEKGSFTFLQLVQKKKELQVLAKGTVNSQDQVIEKLKGQKHVFLILNNEQVLSKKNSFLHDDKKIIVRNAFPNINIGDFYYEVFTNELYSFVTIARKENIDIIITNYQKKGISVIGFSLGNLALKNLITFQENGHLSTSNAIVKFNEETVLDIEKTKQEKQTQSYIINDLEVTNQEVLSLSGIISYYSQNTSSTIQNQLQEKYIQKRFFDVGLKAGLGFLLIVLLFNFFIFSNYRDKVGGLTGELQMSETYKNQLNKLQKLVNQKKQLVKSVHSASNISLSKYFNEIGRSLPETNLLTQLYYQPQEGIQKKDKAISFQEKKIIVKGISKNDDAFSNWISQLEKKSWIKEVSIITYGKGKKTSRTSSFELIISTND